MWMLWVTSATQNRSDSLQALTSGAWRTHSAAASLELRPLISGCALYVAKHEHIRDRIVSCGESHEPASSPANSDMLRVDFTGDIEAAAVFDDVGAGGDSWRGPDQQADGAALCKRCKHCALPKIAA